MTQCHIQVQCLDLTQCQQVMPTHIQAYDFKGRRKAFQAILPLPDDASSRRGVKTRPAEGNCRHDQERRRGSKPVQPISISLDHRGRGKCRGTSRHATYRMTQSAPSHNASTLWCKQWRCNGNTQPAIGNCRHDQDRRIGAIPSSQEASVWSIKV